MVDEAYLFVTGVLLGLPPAHTETGPVPVRAGRGTEGGQICETKPIGRGVPSLKLQVPSGRRGTSNRAKQSQFAPVPTGGARGSGLMIAVGAAHNRAKQSQFLAGSKWR